MSGRIPSLSAMALVTWLIFMAVGCATRDVNPAQPQPGKGYVDCYTEQPEVLHWDVSRVDAEAGRLELLFSERKAARNGFVRLALEPGPHELRIAFLNVVMAQPAEAQVQVEAGRIVPVRVEFAGTREAAVTRKERTYGPTAYGRYGRRSETSVRKTAGEVLTARPDGSVPYRTKPQMPYAR